MMLCSVMIGLHLTRIALRIINKKMHDIVNDTYMNIGKMN
jgi:hypothetical protein